MTKMLMLGMALVCGAICGCASDAAGPQSEYGDMPWNPPQPGEGGGVLGGMLGR